MRDITLWHIRIQKTLSSQPNTIQHDSDTCPQFTGPPNRILAFTRFHISYANTDPSGGISYRQSSLGGLVEKHINNTSKSTCSDVRTWQRLLGATCRSMRIKSKSLRPFLPHLLHHKHMSIVVCTCTLDSYASVRVRPTNTPMHIHTHTSTPFIMHSFDTHGRERRDAPTTPTTTTTMMMMLQMLGINNIVICVRTSRKPLSYGHTHTHTSTHAPLPHHPSNFHDNTLLTICDSHLAMSQNARAHI